MTAMYAARENMLDGGPGQDVDMDTETQLAMAEAAGFGLVTVAMAAAISDEQVRGWAEETDYSEKYCDDVYEYRRVTVPRSMLQANAVPQNRTMTEQEWRSRGVTMSRGWEHYDHHVPEANVLLFRRVLGTDPRTGEPPKEMLEKVAERARYVEELQQARQEMLLEQQRRQEQGAPEIL